MLEQIISELEALRKCVAGLATKEDLRETSKTMATKADLDAAIAALPAALTTALDNALAPIIAAITAKAGNTDFQPEIDALNAVGATVATKVAADVTPAS